MVLIRLREEMRRGRGCPICNLILDVEERSIENILYEMVNDPAVRNRIRSSLGFCPFHAHQVIDFVKRNPWLDGLGTSIIYLDMVETYLDMIENGGAMSITDMWASCYLCEKAEEFERIYVETLSICFEEDQKLLENYASSSSLLCARHLESVYNRLNRVIGKKILTDTEREAYQDSPAHEELHRKAGLQDTIPTYRGIICCLDHCDQSP
jgi:hypothetical protein